MDSTLLEKRIAELENRLDAYEKSSSLPRALETALRERLGIKSLATFIGTSSAGTTVAFNSFPVTVPAQPSGAVTVSINGTTYNLLYK